MPVKLKGLFVLALVLAAGWLSLPTQAAPAPGTIADPQLTLAGDERPLSTAELIQAALARGEIDQESAARYLAYALTNHPALPEVYRSAAPWDGTIPLLELRQTVTVLRPGPARAEVEALLAGICSDSNTPLPNEYNSTYFYIEYGPILAGLTISDYAVSLDTSWERQVNEFGWAAPPVYTPNPPPGGRYHVRVDDLGPGLYGFVSTGGTYAGLVGDNPNTPWTETDAYASCMALNNNFGPPFPGSPQQALDATTAHEFNHSIQAGYAALSGSNRPDSSFVEGGATWMEDEVFDDANDNYNYLWPTFSNCLGQYQGSPYPYWITFRGLTERYGAGVPGGGEQVMQDFWELTSQDGFLNNQLDNLNQALQNKGTNLPDAYHAYAVAVKFNHTCSGGYSYPYCLEEGPNYVAMNGPTAVHGTIGAVGSSYSGSVLNNYALNWVQLPTGSSPYEVTLNNTASAGQLRATVACDDGTTLNLSPLPTVVTAGASATTIINPAGCTSVVAVITNQEQTAPNPVTCTAQAYTLATEAGGAGPSISISNATTTEGDAGTTNVTLTVTLSAPASAGAVTVDYSTYNDTANAGSDYLPMTSTLSFSGATTAQTITVAIVGDLLQENDELFFVNLSNPTNGAIADGQGMVAIVDNDIGNPTAVSVADLATGRGSVAWRPLLGLLLAGSVALGVRWRRRYRHS